MKFHYTIPLVLMGMVTNAIIQPQLASALTRQQIRDAAEKLTVLIRENGRPKGSGTILRKIGNTYYVLTSWHLVENYQSKYEVVTTDKKIYQITPEKIIRLPGVDLAVVQFESQGIYSYVEQSRLGNSELITMDNQVHIFGYPISVVGINNEPQLITATISSLARQEDGYALTYTGDTFPGMSGSPIFDGQGRLIGIHGRGALQEMPDGDVSSVQLKLGIPINTFVKLITPASVNKGNEKLNRQDYRGAIADFSLGLEFNKSADAFLGRGYAHFALGDYNNAEKDAREAIALNPQTAPAYLLQGASIAQKGNHGQAIRVLTRAIELDGNLAEAYGWRAVSRAENKDIKGANQDIEQNLRLTQNSPNVYFRRSLVRTLGNDGGAAEDIQKANQLAANYRENNLYQMALNRNLNSLVSNRITQIQQAQASRNSEKSPVSSDNRNPSVNNNSNNQNNTFQQQIAILPQPDLVSRIINATAKVLSVALSPDGRILASLMENGRIQLWDFSTGSPLRPLAGHPVAVRRSIAFNQNGRQLVSGGLDGIKIWDVQRGIQLKEIPLSLPKAVSIQSIAFNSSGQRVVIGMTNGTIRIWQVTTGQELKGNFPRHSKGISALVYSSDGTMAASGSEDGMIKVWSLQQGQIGRVLHNFTEHKDWISAIAFSPDGQTLVSSSMDKTIKIWDLKTNKLRYNLEVNAPVSASDVAISPDGKTLASANSKEIRLWNLSDGQLVGMLPEHTALVRSLVFSPDGKLISASQDSTIRIWQRKQEQ